MAYLLRFILTISAVLIGCQSVDADDPETPLKVTLHRDGDQWKLLRAGKPHYIRGAGGQHLLKVLADCGGNSNRLWNVGESTRQRLDEAHENGISVAVGIWLEHETKGYDYQDFDQVNEQIERVMAAVREFKNHPAVLLWGVGNEMEGYQTGDNPAVWSHVEHLCRLIKREDPNHPTMSVIAEIGGNRIAAINKFCPSLDIIGINAYGGAATLPKRYREAGGEKPYIVSEFGPAGPWEVERNKIGAVLELSSNDKALQYRRTYESLKADSEYCLGSYAFLWGHKMEATDTWFGMFTRDGRKTNLVDTMSELWDGKAPINHCPAIDMISISDDHVGAKQPLEIRLNANDPEGDPLKVEWKLMPEADSYITAGDFQAAPAAIEDAFTMTTETIAKLRAPKNPGLYRVYAIVDDGHGAVATANVPFKVKFSPIANPGAEVDLPFLVYDDIELSSPICPIEKIGDVHATEIQADYESTPKFGRQCICCRIAEDGKNGGGVIRYAGGACLTGATKLNVWAKGKTGTETITVGLGRRGAGADNANTVAKQKEIQLTRHWKKFQLFFANSDLRRVESVFYWTAQPNEDPVEFYLDRIEIE